MIALVTLYLFLIIYAAISYVDKVQQNFKTSQIYHEHEKKIMGMSSCHLIRRTYILEMIDGNKEAEQKLEVE